MSLYLCVTTIVSVIGIVAVCMIGMTKRWFNIKDREVGKSKRNMNDSCNDMNIGIGSIVMGNYAIWPMYIITKCLPLSLLNCNRFIGNWLNERKNKQFRWCFILLIFEELYYHTHL